MDKNFDSLAIRLEKKIYGTEKGFIRYELLKQDILDYCPDFTKKRFKVLDAGGGSGRFSRFCASYNHQVLLCDISSEMLSMAMDENKKRHLDDKIKILQSGLMTISAEDCGYFDLVLLHGVAEWMDNPSGAIKHCCSLLKPGGYLSLLVYNKNKYLLKRGFNGRLLKKDSLIPSGKKLTPTGKMSPEEVKLILDEYDGEVKISSGIRVFNSFLKTIQPLPITAGQWLEQERLYYRTEPFASLGEHSHIIWQKK
jgi:S-adenosylmethionine-dependent methyltransferase